MSTATSKEPIMTVRTLLGWIDERFPLTALWKEHVAEYYAPKNFNFWYFFGSLALLVLVIQIVTGIFLTMNYKPDAAQAFASVEYIMRDVPWGWLIRYMHSTGASVFFIVVYLHMFRGLHVRLLPQAARADLDLRLLDLPVPDGRGVLRLPAAVGPDVLLGRAGDRQPVRRDPVHRRGPRACGSAATTSISDATLNRFFAFHVIAVPLVLLGPRRRAHHGAARGRLEQPRRHRDQEAAEGPATGHPLDGIPFHPYYTVKDIVGVVVFLVVFSRRSCSSCRRWAATSSSTTTSSRPIR